MPTLKKLREKLYWSQEDLAKESEMTTGTINRLENGRQKPRLTTIRKLAKALSVEPGDIEFRH
jgi:transcriptional regulator with XRE-family HTH domain